MLGLAIDDSRSLQGNDMAAQVHWIIENNRRVGAYRTDDNATASAAPGCRLKSLVVDDHPIHRSLLAGMMEILFPGSSVDLAEDGVRAQEKLRAGRYDIVLCDWFMPKMDGLQLAEWLRSGETPKQPFVLVSAHDEAEVIAPLIASRAIDGYLIKPFDQTALKEVITIVGGIHASSA